jgi:hypothetical protein
MLQLQYAEVPARAPSPLVLCDRLLTLAQDADRAGCVATAERLLKLAYSVFDEDPPRLTARSPAWSGTTGRRNVRGVPRR